VLGIAMAPLRLVDRILGGGGPPVPPMPVESSEADDVPAAPAPDYKLIYEQLAIDVLQWCCDSLVAGGHAPIPSKMPRGISAWLPGLTREECVAIGSADRMAVSAHLCSYELVRGVRSVRPLDRVEWPPETEFAPDQGSGRFLSFVAGAGTAPSSAADRAL
jgi:hypothetical protein